MSTVAIAARTIARTRGPSAVVVLTLAVAIGGATTIYSVVDVFWHYLPAQRQDRLVYVASTVRPAEADAGANSGVPRTGVSVPDLLDLTARTQTIEQFAGFSFGTATLNDAAVPERVAALRATANLLSVWGMAPAFGRFFRPDEGRPGSARVVLITNAFWQRWFDARSSVLGQSLVLDGEPHTIIGVLPSTLDRGMFAGTDLMLPLSVEPGGERDDRRIFLSGLLKPGVTREQARADLERVTRQLQVEYPRTNGRTGIVVRPFMEMLGGETPMLLALLVILALLLIALACANVSNVMLAAATARQREFAVRAALGASLRHRLAQLVTEGLLLATMAAAGGVALAWSAISGLQALDPSVDSFGAISMNPRVILAAIAMALLAAVGFSLAPALRTAGLSAQAVNAGSAGGGEPGSTRRLRQIFAAAQVALAIVLITQIAAIGRSAWSYRTRELGFDERALLTFNVELASSRYPDAAAIRRFIAQVLPRIEAVPAVASVAVTNRLPIAERELAAQMRLEGTSPLPEEMPAISLAKVSDRYFDTLRIPIVRGRSFDAADIASRRQVALVSLAAVRRYWPTSDPIGARITLDTGGGEPEWLEIVGIAGDVRNSNVESAAPLQVYVPITLAPDAALSFAVRSAGTDPTQLTSPIRAAIAAVDNQEPAFAIRTMARVIADDLRGTILITSVLIAVALISTALAAAGIYGVTSYSVVRRTRELGIRTALGAAPAAVVRLILAQSAGTVAIGAAVGIAAAIPLGTVAASAIPDIDFFNPATYSGVVAGLVAVAVIAMWAPARRAARVDPTTALRSE